MKEKGHKTREAILDSAYEVFSAQGYSKVSMHDICVKTGLSRGGLYRYFSSTKEIFAALLDNEINSAANRLQDAKDNDVSPNRLLDSYFSNCKMQILGKNNGFFFATHEFAFVETTMRKFMKERFDDALKMLTSILLKGQQEGVFKEKFEPRIMAEHILFTIDSFQTSAAILGVSEDRINEQIELLKNQVRK